MLDDLPAGWERTTFGDCFDFKGGTQPPKQTFVYEPTEGYVRLLQIRDFESDDKPAYILETASSVRCEKDDILIARYGASLGRILRGKEGAYNVALVKLSFRKPINRDFAFAWLNSDNFQAPLIRVGSRSAQAGFNKSDLAPFQILLPPLPEQERIAEILTSVDDSIRATEAVIAQAERVKRGLMEDLLTGGLGSEAIAHGEVPEGWRITPLRDVCVIAGEYGANAPKEDFDPSLPRYVRITDIDDRGNLNPNTAVSISREKAGRYILSSGDIVIARSGATVGKSYVHKSENGECAFAGYLVRFRLNPDLASHDWLRHVLQSKTYWDWVRDNQRAGAQPNINAKEYGGYELVLPPVDQQKRTASILASLDDQVTSNRQTIDQLQRLKRGLMDDLLTGRVRTV